MVVSVPSIHSLLSHPSQAFLQRRRLLDTCTDRDLRASAGYKRKVEFKEIDTIVYHNVLCHCSRFLPLAWSSKSHESSMFRQLWVESFTPTGISRTPSSPPSYTVDLAGSTMNTLVVFADSATLPLQTARGTQSRTDTRSRTSDLAFHGLEVFAICAVWSSSAYDWVKVHENIITPHLAPNRDQRIPESQEWFPRCQHLCNWMCLSREHVKT